MNSALRLEAFESQDQLAKLVREAGDALGNCRKELVGLDPSSHTAMAVKPILDKVTCPAYDFLIESSCCQLPKCLVLKHLNCCDVMLMS